jgi:glycosyltransferase involved in cell wall biosynthesis
MRVLQVMAGAAHGGAETCFVDTVLALHRAGLDQRVVIRRDAARAALLRAGGIDPIELPFGARWIDFRTRLGLARVGDAYRPDIVMAWMRRAGSYMTRGSAVNLGWFGGFYDLKYYRNCDHLVGMSADMRDHIVKSGWPAGRAHILRAYAPEATGRRLDRPQAPLLLALGRLHEAKAFDVLIDAMVEVPDAHLWIAGEGDLRPALEQQIARLDLGDRVRLLGWRNDRQDLLATCDICVFPSRYEPFGIVSIEAWAARVPLIATRSAGPGALIEDGSDGLLVPIDDRAALTAAMKRLLGNRDLQAKLVEGGRRRYEAEFTEAAVVASYQALFERMLAERKRAA